MISCWLLGPGTRLDCPSCSSPNESPGSTVNLQLQLGIKKNQKKSKLEADKAVRLCQLELESQKKDHTLSVFGDAGIHHFVSSEWPCPLLGDNKRSKNTSTNWEKTTTSGTMPKRCCVTFCTIGKKIFLRFYLFPQTSTKFCLFVWAAMQTGRLSRDTQGNDETCNMTVWPLCGGVSVFICAFERNRFKMIRK